MFRAPERTCGLIFQRRRSGLRQRQMHRARRAVDTPGPITSTARSAYCSATALSYEGMGRAELSWRKDDGSNKTPAGAASGRGCCKRSVRRRTNDDVPPARPVGTESYRGRPMTYSSGPDRTHRLPRPVARRAGPWLVRMVLADSTGVLAQERLHQPIALLSSNLGTPWFSGVRDAHGR
jgi:hypothetical protein